MLEPILQAKAVAKQAKRLGKVRPLQPNSMANAPDVENGATRRQIAGTRTRMLLARAKARRVAKWLR